MNNTIKYITAFTVGAAVGSLITCRVVRAKYEQLAQEEIDSVKEVFAKRNYELASKTMADADFDKDNIPDILEKAKQAKEKPEISEYISKTQKSGYIDYTAFSSKPVEPKIEEEVPVENDDETESDEGEKPYVISPDEFGEIDDYERIGLNYFADKVVAYDDDTRFENVNEIIGLESLTHFGEYEDDSVFVRNDKLKIDYEILLDRRKYSDVIGKKPHQIEE
jgi:hypothetical protein